jgi:quercetin dioxygenase-like cupin family protein
MPTATRVHETPNAVMTTLASPTLNGSGLAVWRVEMEPGATGPEHAVDAEQVLAVTDGELTVLLDGAEHRLVPGDALPLPPGRVRRIVNEGPAAAAAMVSSFPGATATVPGKEPVPIPWAG